MVFLELPEFRTVEDHAAGENELVTVPPVRLGLRVVLKNRVAFSPDGFL
jgi:hypothetical protein